MHQKTLRKEYREPVAVLLDMQSEGLVCASYDADATLEGLSETPYTWEI